MGRAQLAQKSGATMGHYEIRDKRLRALVEAWETLPGRVRQSMLRHTDSRLTEDTYFDKQKFLAPQQEQINSAAPIPIYGSAPETNVSPAKPQAPYGRPKPRMNTEHGSQLAHNGGVFEGQLQSQPGTQSERECLGSEVNPADKNPQDVSGIGTKRHDPASCDTGSEEKRAKGVEPSTFTLAT